MNKKKNASNRCSICNNTDVWSYYGKTGQLCLECADMYGASYRTSQENDEEREKEFARPIGKIKIVVESSIYTLVTAFGLMVLLEVLNKAVTFVQ